MTNLEQSIIDKIHRFPPEKQKRVLEYAESLETNGETPDEQNETIWEMIQDLAENVSDDAWDELPVDGAANVDHYLYGHPKKSK